MRYQIIDMDKIRSGKCHVPNPDGNLGLNIDLALLSEEESLEKFRFVYMRGAMIGAEAQANNKTLVDYENIWEELSKTL